jgi:DNA transformation protein
MDAEFIRELFSSFRPVTIRRMFSGAGLFVDGVMFALVVDQAIYLKVGETNEPDFLREDLPPFGYTTSKGRRAVMSYRRMPDRLYDDPDELAQWAGKALQAAQRKATPRKSASKSKAVRKKPKVSRS